MLVRVAPSACHTLSRAMRPGRARRAPSASFATRLLLCVALASARVVGARGADLGASVHRRHAPPSAFRGCEATLDGTRRGRACAYHPPPRLERSSGAGPPLRRCELRWYRQRLDHFSFGTASDDPKTAFFSQRYFLCARRHFDPDAPAVFFYTGNEADVELYVNATGLMWEMSAENGTRALLVFAEHRYYGQSRPSAMDDRKAPKRDRLAFLNAEQALADYAELLRHVVSRDVPRIARERRRRRRRSRVPLHGGSRNEDAIGLSVNDDDAEKRRETTSRDEVPRVRVVDSRRRFSSDTLEALDPESVAVVAFGGSYGGMLATWFRAKYPHVVDGAVAGSAPIWSFTGETPPVDPNAFALGVSFDATAWGGSPAACEGNVRAAFAELLSRTSSSSAGVASIAAPLRLCASSVPTTADDVVRIAYWLQDAFDYLAMGNFPYPDSYILMGDGTLPAFPFRAACAKTASAPNLARREKKKPDVLLEVLADFADVYYNYTRRLPCFDLKGTNGGGPNAASAADSSLWDWQFCTEMFMPTARDGVRDIFFPQPWNATRARARCVETWGVEPRATWADTSFGGRRLRALSNVVWSNGALDPWSRLGVNRDTDFLGVLDSRRGLEAVRLPNGAHHLDFFWSRDDDDDDTRRARSRESALVRRWIEEKHAVGGGKRRNGAVVA